MLGAAFHPSVLPRCQGTHSREAAPSHWALGVGLSRVCFFTLEAGPISKALDQPSQPTPPASGTHCLSQGVLWPWTVALPGSFLGRLALHCQAFSCASSRRPMGTPTH